jgi:hypothetical protein
MSISAKSAASTPPAPARMATTASRESYSPERRVRTSISSTAFCRAVISSPTSAMDPSSLSACAISSRSSASSMRLRRRSSREISPVRYDRRELTSWARAWSSQRSGAEACSSSSARSRRSFSMSRTFSMLRRVASRALSCSG